MNLYYISQNENRGYDTFDSAIVAAKSEGEARQVNPDSSGAWKSYSRWCSNPEQVEVELIGKAKAGTEAGIILASFNAG